jgi:hypothetical protein
MLAVRVTAQAHLALRERQVVELLRKGLLLHASPHGEIGEQRAELLEILGVKTEQETVTQALDLVIAEAPILRVHRKLKGVGGFEDVFR